MASTETILPHTFFCNSGINALRNGRRNPKLPLPAEDVPSDVTPITNECVDLSLHSTSLN
jgi:hypothetical protein